MTGPSSSGGGGATAMGGDLLTPLSAGLEGLSLGGKTQPSYQVRLLLSTQYPTLVHSDYIYSAHLYIIINVCMYCPLRDINNHSTVVIPKADAGIPSVVDIKSIDVYFTFEQVSSNLCQYSMTLYVYMYGCLCRLPILRVFLIRAMSC